MHAEAIIPNQLAPFARIQLPQRRTELNPWLKSFRPIALLPLVY